MAKEMLSQSKISLHSLRNDMLSVLVSKLEGSSKLAKQTSTIIRLFYVRVFKKYFFGVKAVILFLLLHLQCKTIKPI